MVLQTGSSWIIIIVPRDASCQFSQFWVYAIVPFSKKLPKFGPFMAKTWSSHYPTNRFSWILIIVPRDVPCKISHCWVYPVAPFPKNSKIWPFYWQNMVFTCSLILVLPESQSMCPGVLHAKFHIAGFILKLPFIEMGKIWPFSGQNMVLTWFLKLVLPES